MAFNPKSIFWVMKILNCDIELDPCTTAMVSLIMCLWLPRCMQCSSAMNIHILPLSISPFSCRVVPHLQQTKRSSFDIHFFNHILQLLLGCWGISKWDMKSFKWVFWVCPRISFYLGTLLACFDPKMTSSLLLWCLCLLCFHVAVLTADIIYNVNREVSKQQTMHLLQACWNAIDK